MKKITLILVCIFIFMLTGCQTQDVLPDKKTPPVHSSNTGENPPGSNIPNDTPANSPDYSADFSASNNDSAEVDTTGFQKEMNVQHPFRLRAACKTELGYYLHYDAFLYFLDAATGNVTIVCARPECSHTSNDCSAFLNSGMLSYYQGKLYYKNGDVKSDSMETLYSMELNGTDHRKLQRLQFEFMPYRTVLGEPMLVNGNLYFLEGDYQIYTVKLGQDVSKAVLLFNDDMSRKLESAWKFWADGSEIYAMNHILDAGGNYQDILYRLGENESETRVVWRSAEIGISYKNDSVSSWYITNGHLYYYFSGNDLWDIELGTGKAEKIISLTDTLKNGTALFTDSCAIFLDDQPDSRWPGQSVFREGGKIITVYDYSGNLLSEVDLTSIYEKYSDTVHCEFVFADGNRVYLLVNRGMDNSTSTLLYQVNWEKGSIYKTANWPGADVIFDNTPSGEWLTEISSKKRELKNEGSLRGEIEVTHKLSVGKKELSDGDTVLFHIETKSADAELKITLTGAETGTILEGYVTGSGEMPFEINTADEYSVVIENCGRSAVQFTIDYSIGGSK